MQTPCSEPTFTGSLVLLDPDVAQNEPNSTLTGSMVFLDPDAVTTEPTSTFTGSVVRLDPDVVNNEPNSTLTGSVVFADPDDPGDIEEEDLSMSYIVPAEYDSESGLETVVSGPPDGVLAGPSAEPSDETTGVVDCVPEDDEREETLKQESSPPKPIWHRVAALPRPTPVPRPEPKRESMSGLVADHDRRSPLPPIPSFEPAPVRRSRSRIAPPASSGPPAPRLSSLPPPPRVPRGLMAASVENSKSSATQKLSRPAVPSSFPDPDGVTLPGRRSPASRRVRVRALREAREESSPDARDSVVPVVRGAQPPPLKPKRWRALLIVAGVLCGIAVFLLGFLVVEAHGRAAKAAQTPALIVTVAQVGGFRVSQLEVFIDGSKRCQASPCVITELSPGFHFVTVVAPGHVAPAPRAIRTVDGEPGNMHFDLTSEVQSFAVPPPESISVNALPAEVPLPATATAVPAPAKEVPAVAAVKPPAPKPAIRFGYLSFNSIPMSNVVVDGRPVGKTPKMSVRVRAGKHNVVFVHSEQGRRAQSVFVAPGARRTVAVRF